MRTEHSGPPGTGKLNSAALRKDRMRVETHILISWQGKKRLADPENGAFHG